MTNDPYSPTDLVDKLDNRELLGLAQEAGESDGRPRTYSVPTVEDLAGLFPQLEVMRLIGSGGMGCVFQARHRRLERMVALKILPAELAEDGLFAERFSREARAMARLNHPHIIAIHDFGQEQGLHFLTMEYMDGMNLRDLLESGPISVDDVLSIFDQVCQALAYAHAEGVVHRDIKPENILFNRQGHVSLADFGLARLAVDSNCEVSLTQTRQAMGTLNYMAPEQWENPKSADHRADIYALGILLYELLTGRVPRGSFPPASTLANVGTAVDEALHKALQVNPDDRHQTVQEFCSALVTGVKAGEPATADHYGTFTKVVQAGQRFARVLPVPRGGDSLSAEGGAPQADKTLRADDRSVTTICFWSAVIILALTIPPWGSFEGGGSIQGIESHTILEGVEIPNAMIPIAGGLIWMLSLARKKLHPIRADLVSLILGGLAITQLALNLSQGVYGLYQTTPMKSITVLPFLCLLVFSFLELEILIRIGRSLFLTFASSIRFYVEREEARKEESRQRWSRRWDRAIEMVRALSGAPAEGSSATNSAKTAAADSSEDAASSVKSEAGSAGKKGKKSCWWDWF